MTKRLDLAILYLRIAVGGVLLLHNIGELQDYNTLIGNYPAWRGVAGSAIFAVTMAAEAISAMMLIIGWRVRLAAIILIAQSIFSLFIYHPTQLPIDQKLGTLYIFVYIYIFIAGGGLYSFDNFRESK